MNISQNLTKVIFFDYWTNTVYFNDLDQDGKMNIFDSGVFFRKCTRDQGSKLGLKGWCRNTESGTVEGVLEGTPEQVNMM